MGQQVDIKKTRKKNKVFRFIAYVFRIGPLITESYSVLPRGTHKTRKLCRKWRILTLLRGQVLFSENPRNWLTLKCSYLGNRLCVGLQISNGSQSTMASQLSQILATWLKALSSSIAYISTPVDKAKCARIHAI